MLRILESQAPAKQNATDTIATLCNRLTSATLLEDRRAAILGLRSFAKLYPASVASGALRDLIASLRKDGDDSDTIKSVLETLLGLFQPDEKSDEASDEITLWLADEFTQRQDNITALLDLLESSEFYLRLYLLQILMHICTARPQRAQEAIFTAPLGVSRITAILDERREAVRNEALTLLVALTPTSPELQKVVAFENAFDRIFTLIHAEGSLTHGSTTVQDCLSLLANLLTLNPSNQSYFREIGGIMKVRTLLADALAEAGSADGVSDWIKPQRDMNIWGLLAIVQLFLSVGAQSTPTNQAAFWQSGILTRMLQIGFNPTFGVGVRAKAIDTCGAIIRGNSRLQEQFGDFAVQLHRDAPGGQTNGQPKLAAANVIEALLELTLTPAPIAIFDVRLASCNCIKSFIENHPGIRMHVLRRAIEGHVRGDDQIPNILTVLMESPSLQASPDPYQQWMGSVLLFHLLYENSDTKATAMKVSEGDAESGEEVVTLIQTITSNVIACVAQVEHERSVLGYLMLLCTWLFEEPDAVNDLLVEGSNVQGLMNAVKTAQANMPLVAGLCAVLLGIIYEFSTKDSPIPRTKLYELLNGLGRETYVDRLVKLRENIFVRDFEVLPQGSNGGLPEVFFDKTFMDFLKDNYSRLLRAIDRDPKFEVSIVSNGVQIGVSRELVDILRAEVEESKRALESTNTELMDLRRKLEQEELEHKKTRDSTMVELARIKQINQSLQKNHDDELAKLERDLTRTRDSLARTHQEEVTKRSREQQAAMDALIRRHAVEIQQQEQKAKTQQQEHELAVSKLITQHQEVVKNLETEAFQLKTSSEREMNNLKAELELLLAEFDRLTKASGKQVDQLQKQIATLEAEITKAEEIAKEKSKLYEDLEKAYKQSQKVQEADSAKTDQLRIEVTNLRTELAKAEKIHAQDLQAASKDYKVKKIEFETKAKRVETSLQEALSKVEKLAKDLESEKSGRKDVQTELDDLLVVFADVEAKSAGRKLRLKELGELVSDDDDDEGAVDDEEEEEEEEEEEDEEVQDGEADEDGDVD